MAGQANSHAALAGHLDASFLHGLFESVGLAIVACEPDGRVVACNSAAADLFGRAQAATPGIHVSELFPERDRQRVRQLLFDATTTLEPREYQTQLGRDETGPLDFAVLATPVLEHDGSLRGVSLWMRNITKHRRLQRQLKRNERLTYLGKLAGAVAHHYNNLLCSIATSLEYAMNMNTMTAMRRAAQRTADAVGQAADITRQLLAFAQADYRASDVGDLTEIVTGFLEGNDQRLKSHRVELVFDRQPVPALPVPREQMIIILNHVLNNALEAMPEGGTLRVTLAPLGPEIVCLSIADTGPGISPEHMEHLFEPFFTTKGVLGGGKSANAGLGLAVVHGLVHYMHGAVTAANVPGGGTRLDIVLPLERPEDRQPP
jgi:two-component system cell cycle sensor histidine kinase/response regulator CckA